MTKPRCQAKVYRRDTYRVSRRGDGRHFRMHYQAGQCKRGAMAGSDFCQQHNREQRSGYAVTRCEWATINVAGAPPKGEPKNE